MRYEINKRANRDNSPKCDVVIHLGRLHYRPEAVKWVAMISLHNKVRLFNQGQGRSPRRSFAFRG